MTKMSKAQRTATLAAHENCGFYPTTTNGSMLARMHAAGHTVYRRDSRGVELSSPTRTGLIAAGVDMDALHAEALELNALVEPIGRTMDRDAAHGWALIERDEREQAARTVAVMDALRAEAEGEDEARHNAAAIDGMARRMARRVLEARRGVKITDRRPSGGAARPERANAEAEQLAQVEAAHAEALEIHEAIEAAGRPTPGQCGASWVAEIERCPRCGGTALEHAESWAGPALI